MLQLCVLKKGRKIPNHLYFRKMAKKSRPVRKQFCTKTNSYVGVELWGWKAPCPPDPSGTAACESNFWTCVSVCVHCKKWLMPLPMQMIPDCEYQKSNWSLLLQPRRSSRMREELEIMKNVSLSEIRYFSSYWGYSWSFSFCSLCDVIPAGN